MHLCYTLYECVTRFCSGYSRWTVEADEVHGVPLHGEADTQRRTVTQGATHAGRPRPY